MSLSSTLPVATVSSLEVLLSLASAEGESAAMVNCGILTVVPVSAWPLVE